jgi:hypothetical protein
MEDGFLTFGVRAGTTDERDLDKIDSVLSYSSSLRTAVRLVLKEPAFFGEPKTFSFKFIRVARCLAIARLVVEAHFARIWVENVPARASAISVHQPTGQPAQP